MLSRLQYGGAAVAERLVGSEREAGSFADAMLERHPHTVIAFVGMDFEAKIAAGPGVLVFCRDDRSKLEKAAETAARQGYRGIISFGVAGGLAADLRAGDWVVASSILGSQAVHDTDAAWSKKLLGVIDGARHAPIVGVDTPVAEPTAKRELHRSTGAAAVDMESHVVSRLAAAHRLAFAAVRVIVDSADRTIPRAAILGMGAGGRSDVPALLRDLIAHPSQLPPLVRVAIDAFVARSAMHRVRRLLGPHFGVVDLA